MSATKESVTRPVVRVAHATIRTPAHHGATPARSWPVRDEHIVLHDITLESGEVLDQVTVRYRIEGAINAARDNVILVAHALTGDVHVLEWWKGVAGAHHAIDPLRHAIVSANLLGGCTGSDYVPHTRGVGAPLSPTITTRDQAVVLGHVLDALGVDTPLLVCGGSLGGMVTLEFAATFPQRTRAAVVLAAPAAQTAQGIAWNAIMRRALDVGGERDGLALARMIGMLSYRTPEGLERRFGRARNDDGAFQAGAWLHAHGDRLLQRFDADSYRTLIDAMDTHDVGRGRGGICAALAPVRDRIIGVGIAGDLLYPAESVREWSQLARTRYEEIRSPHGHDAFLLEAGRVSQIVNKALTPQHASPASRAPIKSAVRRTASSNPLRVALAGCGTVGGALLDLLSDHASTQPRPISVVRVLARDGVRQRPSLIAAAERGIAERPQCITDPNRLLDDDIDVLVEAIGGTTTAASLVETALRRGIRVVTANKALLAERGASLVALASLNGTTLDFEAAVAGAVPVVRCVRAGAAGVGITQISGILNGTSNYVLQRVAEGLSLGDAIAEAQRLGYAEQDPTRDLSGEDAEDKLRILAWLAYGVDPATLKVVRRGIDVETASWAARVAREGDRVKLIATCSRDGDQFVARIVPTRVTGDDAWASVTGATNRVVVESASAGALVFYGAGAGGPATAGAVYADLIQRASLPAGQS